MTPTFLDGNKVILAPPEKEAYCAHMMAWVHDDEATALMYTGVFPTSPEDLAAEFDRSAACDNEVVLAVLRKEDGAFIGTVGLYGISWQPRSAEYRIFLGDKSAWNSGYGTETAYLMLGYAFGRLNLNKVFLGVNEQNSGAVRSYEKAGFVHEGRLREEIFRNGRYYDALRMSILRSEWEADDKGKQE